MKKFTFLMIFFALIGCLSAQTYNVTFVVTDGTESYINIKIKGTFTAWATQAMTQDGNVWTITLPVDAGVHEWGAIEDDGSEFGIWLIQGPNRAFTLGTDGTITGDTTYTIPAPGNIDVTINIDMTPAVNSGDFNSAMDYVDVAGSFNSWSGSDPLIEGTNNIFSITVPGFNVGQELQFKCRINGLWDPPTEFPNDGNGAFNRIYVVVDGTNIYNGVYNVPTNCRLTEIKVDDVLIPGFAKDVYDYTVEVLLGTTTVPAVTYKTDTTATATQTDAIAIPGTTTIDVVAVDPNFTNTYSVNFVYQQSIGAIPSGSVSVYPNPVNNLLNVSSDYIISSITICDLIGNQVLIQNSSDKTVKINTSSISNGIYFLNINTDKGSLTKKIQVIR